MVCRENPGRSAVMGWIKKQSRANGDGVLHDAQTQSSLHEETHRHGNATPMTIDEEKAFFQSLIAQVEADPNLTDAEKYREYSGKAGQTGIVTRLREELRQLDTGRDRHGNPIEGTAKANSSARLASMMRMGQMLECQQAATRNFLESNARHRGIGMDQANSEWRQLMGQGGDFSNVSLADTFRSNMGAGADVDNQDTRPQSLSETMSLAGISARDQDELGQSGRARNAMAVMEQRRLDAVASQPARPAMHDDFCTVRTFADANNKATLVRCENCGQFGHQGPACPNESLVTQRAALDAEGVKLDQAREALKWRQIHDANDQQIGAVLDRFAPGTTVAALRERAGAEIERLTGGDELSERDIARRQRDLDDEVRVLRSEFDKSGGSLSWVQEARYNPANGVLQVTPHPYTRKDGTVTPPTPFRRRISPETWEQLTDGSDSFGKRLSDLGLSRNPDESYRFENAADAASANVLTKCATCGQYASMNAQHRCPVKGGPSEKVAARNAAQNQAYRQAVREATGTPPPRPRTLQTGFPTEGERTITIRDADGNPVQGRMSLANRNLVKAATAGDNTIAELSVRAELPDANVTGKVRVWNEDGQRYMSPLTDTGRTSLQCTCNTYRRNGVCNHLRSVATVTANAYEAANGSARRPDLNAESSGGLSLDAPLTPSSRVDYATLATAREARNGDFLAALAKRQHAGELINSPVAMAPRTAAGETIGEPSTWSRDSEQGTRPVGDIDLQDTTAVQRRLRKVLSGRPPRKSFPVNVDSDGGITVSIQRAARGKRAVETQRSQLRELLNLPPNARLDRGYYIPPTGSARYEALDRAYGDPQRVEQSRWVVAPTPDQLAASARARALAEHKH